MAHVIGVTEARIKFKSIIDQVYNEKKEFILARGSRAAAVIIPYDEYIEKEEKYEKMWSERFDNALHKSRNQFQIWLKRKGYNIKKLKEKEIEKIIEEA
jgi:prevent-host-death family protein